LSALAAELAWQVERITESPRGGRAGAVRVARAGGLAKEPLDRLVVLDANQEAAPWSGTSDTFLGEDLVAEITRLEPLAAPAGATLRRAREIGALLLAMSRARHVVMSYRERADDGSPLAPAPLVDGLARGGAISTAWSSTPQSSRPSDEREARVVSLLLR